MNATLTFILLAAMGGPVGTSPLAAPARSVSSVSPTLDGPQVVAINKLITLASPVLQSHNPPPAALIWRSLTPGTPHHVSLSREELTFWSGSTDATLRFLLIVVLPPAMDAATNSTKVTVQEYEHQVLVVSQPNPNPDNPPDPTPPPAPSTPFRQSIRTVVLTLSPPNTEIKALAKNYMNISLAIDASANATNPINTLVLATPQQAAMKLKEFNQVTLGVRWEAWKVTFQKIDELILAQNPKTVFEISKLLKEISEALNAI